MSLGRRRVVHLVSNKTIDQSMSQLLLQGSGDFRMRDYFGLGLSQR